MSAGTRAPAVIFAVGNPSRGDDALGPLLHDCLHDWLAAEGLGAGFELIGDFQLQVEHALDLAGRRFALFSDVAQGVPATWVFRETTAGAKRSPTTHALSPGAVLAVLPLVDTASPPVALVLGVRGISFVRSEAPGAAVLPRWLMRTPPSRCASGAAARRKEQPGLAARHGLPYNRNKY